MKDFEIALEMAEGKINSLVDRGDYTLCNMRITGTGEKARTIEGIEVPFIRPPEYFLSDEFLNECNGLPVALFHPRTKNAKIDDETFNLCTAGTIFYPYIKGDEVWGIAKIYNKEAINAIASGVQSTSPLLTSVSTLENGKAVEDFQSINHLAIVPAGFWDCDDPAIILKGDKDMADEKPIGGIKTDTEEDKETEKVDTEEDKETEKVDTAEDKETEETDTAEDKETAKVDTAEDKETAKVDSDPLSEIMKQLALISARLEKIESVETKEGEDFKEMGEEHEEIRSDERENDEVLGELMELQDNASGKVNIIAIRPKRGESNSSYKLNVLRRNTTFLSEEKASVLNKISAKEIAFIDSAYNEFKINSEANIDKAMRSTSNSYEPVIIRNKDGSTTDLNKVKRLFRQK